MTILVLIAAISAGSVGGRLAVPVALAAPVLQKSTDTPTAAPPPAAHTQPATPPATPSAPPPDLPTVQSDGYTYQTEGRRDPFLNLLGAGINTGSTGKRGDGVAGMATDEISVRGVMQNGGTLVALVIGPDKKTYIIKAGDKLMDGSVKSINQEGLVIVQNVNDPLSLEKTREIRKLLKSLEDAK